MKNNALEQLFQDKLGQLRIEPSEQTKALFDQKLKKKRRVTRVKQFSVAASILVLVSLGIYVIIPEQDDNSLAGTDQVRKLENADNDTNQFPGHEREEEVSNEKNDSDLNSNEEAGRGSAYDLRDTDDDPQRMDPTEKIDKKESDKTSITDQGTDLSTFTALSKHPGNTIIERRPLSVQKDIKTSQWENGFPVKAETDNEIIAGNDKREDSNNSNMTISIEYIPSEGENKENAQLANSLYEKMNTIEFPDELLGDIRSFKDKIFAFEFIKEKKIKDLKQ